MYEVPFAQGDRRNPAEDIYIRVQPIYECLLSAVITFIKIDILKKNAYNAKTQIHPGILHI